MSGKDQVSFRTNSVRSTLTRPADTTTYAQYDVISAATTNAHFTFGNSQGERSRATMPNRNSGVINAVRLFSSANVSTKLDSVLWLFSADIAAVADNAAFAPTDAEMLTCIGVIPIAMANWVVGTVTSGAGGNALCEVKNVDLPFVGGGAGVIYGQLVANNAYVPVSGEIFTLDLIITLDD